MIHVELLSLGSGLVVLDVVEIDSFDPVAEVVLVDVGVSGELERNWEGLDVFETERLQMGLIVKLLLDLIQDHS